MATKLRVFLEFNAYFLPILDDAGAYHVFPVPPSVATVNDVCYHIIKKYKLQSLASNGIQLKIANKYLISAQDKVMDTIKEGDKLKLNIVFMCKDISYLYRYSTAYCHESLHQIWTRNENEKRNKQRIITMNNQCKHHHQRRGN